MSKKIVQVKSVLNVKESDSLSKAIAKEIKEMEEFAKATKERVNTLLEKYGIKDKD